MQADRGIVYELKIQTIFLQYLQKNALNGYQSVNKQQTRYKCPEAVDR